jgi:hypothetical protein
MCLPTCQASIRPTTRYIATRTRTAYAYNLFGRELGMVCLRCENDADFSGEFLGREIRKGFVLNQDFAIKRWLKSG